MSVRDECETCGRELDATQDECDDRDRRLKFRVTVDIVLRVDESEQFINPIFNRLEESAYRIRHELQDWAVDKQTSTTHVSVKMIGDHAISDE